MLRSDDEMGYVDFVIKVYFKDVHPRFPKGGKMSQHLDNMKLGEKIGAIGPKGNMTYLGRGRLELRQGRDNTEIRTAVHIGMIAGGTGITPMLQLVRAALKDDLDKTKFSLIFANQSEGDIMLRKDLDEMAESSGGRFRVGRYHVYMYRDETLFLTLFVSSFRCGTLWTKLLKAGNTAKVSLTPK